MMKSQRMRECRILGVGMTAAHGDRMIAADRYGVAEAVVRCSVGGRQLLYRCPQACPIGYNHNLAIRDDGSLVAWGRSAQGQLNVPAGNDYAL